MAHQHVLHQATVGLAKDDAQAAQMLIDQRDKVFPQGDLTVIGQPDGDRPAFDVLAAYRKCQRLATTIECFADQGGQLIGAHGGAQTTPGAFEQRIGIDLTQAGKRRTDRRLGNPKANGGTAGAAFFDQGDKHAQQVQVD